MKLSLPRAFDALLNRIVGVHGLDLEKAPAWIPLRIALSVSLADPTPPPPFGMEGERGEMALMQLTGLGHQDPSRDFDGAVRLLLMVRHGADFFRRGNEAEYVRLLVDHIGRGLRQLAEALDSGRNLYVLLAELVRSPDQASPGTRVDPLISRLLDIGVGAETLRATQGPRLDHYLLRLTRPEYLAQLERSLDQLAFALGVKGLRLERGDGPMEVALTMPRPAHQWTLVDAKDLRSWLSSPAGKSRLRVFVGVDTTGSPVSLDLVDAPHVMVAGATGSGKTVCVHAMLMSLIRQYSFRDVELVLIDPKRTELAAYAGLPHLRGRGVAVEIPDAVRRLREVEEELDRRLRQLAQAGYRSLEDARDSGALQLPFLVVVVEELADLVLGAPEAQASLVRLAQKARAAGIHLVLATQRPDAETFSGLLRTNVPTRIALTVTKTAESRIILDEEGAEQLLGKGDMLLRVPGRPTQRAHGVFLSAEDILAAVQGTIHGAKGA